MQKTASCQNVNITLQIINQSLYLTHSPAKRQSLAQIRKYNFEISLAIGSILWCLKCIDIWLTPIWTPLWGPGGPKVPKTEKFRALLWNHFRWKSLETLCQFTSHFWNFVEFPYYWENWEYFSNFDFSNFKLQYSFFWQNFEWNFSVTHVLVFSDLSDPLGVLGVT